MIVRLLVRPTTNTFTPHPAVQHKITPHVKDQQSIMALMIVLTSLCVFIKIMANSLLMKSPACRLPIISEWLPLTHDMSTSSELLPGHFHRELSCYCLIPRTQYHTSTGVHPQSSRIVFHLQLVVVLDGSFFVRLICEALEVFWDSARFGYVSVMC